MLQRLSIPFVKLFSRWMPDPYLFAVLLTFIIMLSALFLTPTGPIDIVAAWGNGFWNLLRFTGQMVLVLITGYALAHTHFIHGILKSGASWVKSSFGAYLLVGFFSAAASWINWSMGLIVGAIVAREVALVCREKEITIHYPLLIAVAYSGFVIWHQGLSSSVGLLLATEGHFLEDLVGVYSSSETIFSSWNLIITGAIFLTLPFVMAFLAPQKNAAIPAKFEDREEYEDKEIKSPIKTPADWVEHAYFLNLLVGLCGALYIYDYFFLQGRSLNLDSLNFIFLMLGILLSNSPLHYVNLVARACRSVGPILFQFPFYAGIMGIMSATGLSEMMTDLFLNISTASTLPFWSFISAGILNIFVPSGGGQWVLQGPIVMEAAVQMGADIPKVAMAVAMGDQWTNMIQPFWALPALAIAGLHVRDIMGYCLFALIWSGIIFSLGLLFL